MNKIAYSCSLFIKSKIDFFRVINDVIGVRLSVWRSCWMRVHMTHDKGQHLQYVVSADAVFSFSGRVLIDTKLSSSTFGSLHIRLIRSWCHTSSKKISKDIQDIQHTYFPNSELETKVIKDATERTHLCDLHARDWSGFQFGIALDYSQSGLFSAGNKTNYFLTKISQFFQSPLSAARVAGSIIETGIGTPLQHQMLQRTYCKQNNNIMK